LLSFQEPQTPRTAADNALTPWPAPPPELQGLLERTLRTMPPARPISCSVARRVTLRRSSLAHRLIHSDGRTARELSCGRPLIARLRQRPWTELSSWGKSKTGKALSLGALVRCSFV
jgi:hypothetical protein